MRILGIDPGSRVIGFGLLECSKSGSMIASQYKIMEAGVLRANLELPLVQRIGSIHQAMYDLTKQLKPNYCVIESAFMGVNAQSALKLGQARGALISAMSRCDVPIHEIAPTKVKKLMAGVGHGTKEQVSEGVQRLLKVTIPDVPSDVTDALAIALSFMLISGRSLRLRTK